MSPSAQAQNKQMAANFGVLIVLLSVLVFTASGTNSSQTIRTFTVVNDCKETVWPGITNATTFPSGFTLNTGQASIFAVPSGWSGRIWGRTGCNFNNNGNGTCKTGSCDNSLNCTGPGRPPTSIAEFTLGEPDFYDVSLVSGFNLPLVVVPINGKGNCKVAGCDKDLRSNCSSELALKDEKENIYACQSACDVFNTDEYCCRGIYQNPTICLPSNYSRSFKEACPAAYSYAYDDPSSIRTCTAMDYVVTFCGSRNQSACTFHDSKLICSESTSLQVFLHMLWVFMIPTLLLC